MEKALVYFIDTFTSERFKGNPAAVCILSRPVSHPKMLLIAKEFNLPVTAFVEKTEINSDVYNIYYFTTLAEIPACGHGTLAAAKAVAMLNNPGHFQFKTKEGIVIAAAVLNDEIVMTYPQYGVEEFSVSTELAKSLSLEDFISVGFARELETLFIELPDPGKLRNVRPDFNRLMRSSEKLKEVVITSLSEDTQYDYLLRSFCPWIGIDEDPVTGSVHSVLAGFWGNRLNKKNLRAYQASERGGELFVTNNKDKVELGGHTILVMEGFVYF
jgi:PhzF family phenazine biosynthesis protein